MTTISSVWRNDLATGWMKIRQSDGTAQRSVHDPLIAPGKNGDIFLLNDALIGMTHGFRQLYVLCLALSLTLSTTFTLKVGILDTSMQF